MFVVKSILQGFLTLFLVSLLIFVAYRLMPVDEVEAYNAIAPRFSTWKQVEQYQTDYQNIAHDLNLDLPIFYFSISKHPYNQRFFSTTFPDDKVFLTTVLAKKYDAQTAFYLLDYERNYQKYLYFIKEKKIDSTLNLQPISDEYLHSTSILQTKKPFLSSFLLEEKKQLDIFFTNEKPFERSEIPIADVTYFTWKPYFYINGRNCQFHHWLQKIIVGDFGRSFQTHRPVFDEIKDAIRWTFLINIIAFLLIFYIGIALGLKSAEKYGQRFDNILMRFSFVSDAIPPFWLATLFVVFLTTSYYHIKIFPSAGLGDFPSDASFFQKAIIALPHFIAPVLCMIITSISLIIRQMRSSAIQIFQQDFIKTAKAKGLSEKSILQKHVLPNAIFPILSLIGIALPEIIVGSVLLENIFNIPGMGKLMVVSIAQKDFPVMIAIVLLIACATLLAAFFTNLLYNIFNPLTKIKNH
jgi:peptide/nickel transport system permease protein